MLADARLRVARQLLRPVVAVLLLGAAAAQATWTGAVDSIWNTPGNWSPSIVPGAGTDVIIAAAAKIPSVYTANPTCNSLTINAGATMALAGGFDLTVASNLVVSGTLNVVSATSIIDVNGNVTVNSGGVLALNSGTHRVAGNWTSNAGTASVTGSGTIQFDGTGTTVTGTHSLPSVNVLVGTRTFLTTLIAGNLSASTPGICSFQAANTTTVNGNLDFSFAAGIGGGGTLDVNGSVLELDTPGTSLLASSVIRCGGTWSATSLFHPPASSTVILDSAVVINVLGSSPLNFGNLKLEGGPKIFGIGLNVTGNFTLTSGSAQLSGQNTVAGNWTSAAGAVTGAGASIVFSGTGTTTTGANSIPAVQVTGGTRTWQSSKVGGNLTMTAGTCSYSTGTTTTVTGDLSFDAGTFISGGGALDVDGNVLKLDASSAGLGAASVIHCGGNWNSGAAFDPPAGSTVILDAALPATVNGTPPIDFANLILQGGPKTITASCTVDGNFVLLSGSVQLTSQNTVAGDWTSTGGAVTGSGVAIIFTGTGTTTTGANSIPDVHVTGGTRTWKSSKVSGNLSMTAGTCNFASNGTTTVTGNLNFSAGSFISGGGTLDVDGKVLQLDASAAGLGATSVLICGGSWSSGAAFDPPADSTVILTAVLPVSVGGASPVNFGNLTLENGPKNFSVPFKVDGSFTLSSGSAQLSGTSTVTGDWISTAGAVTGGGSPAIVFDGSGITWTAANSIPSVSVTGGGRSWLTSTIAGPLTVGAAAFQIDDGNTVTVNGDASFAGGSLVAGENALAGPVLDVNGNVSMGAVASFLSADTEIRCSGNWTSGSTFNPGAALVRLDGGGATQLSGAAPGFDPVFSTLVVSNGTHSLGTDLKLTAAVITIDADSALSVGGRHLTIPGGVLTANGALMVGADGEISLGSGVAATVSPNSGVLRVIGTSGHPARLDGFSGGGYALTVNGLLSTFHFVFENMGPAGIVLGPTCIFDPPPFDLRSGTFDKPFAAGSPLLDLQLAGAHECRDLTFLNTLGVAGAFNARRTAGSAITFTNFMGAFAGAAFEDDPGGTPGFLVWPMTSISGFTARAGPAKATLTWTSVQEFNIDKWVLEDSTGGPFSSIKELAPTGDGSAYSFVQAPATPDVVHTYRLSERVNGGAVNVLGTAQATPWPAAPPDNVLVVGGGGPYADIQSAVNAATAPFSIIEVSPGTHAAFSIGPTAPFGLRIAGDGTGPVIIDTAAQAVTLSGVPLGGSVELADLTIGSAGSANAGLVVSSCSGLVLLDQLVVHGGVGTPGLQLIGSTATVIQRSNLDGVPGLKLESGARATASRGTLDDLDLSGNSALTTCQLTAPGPVGPGSTLTQLAGLMPTITSPKFQPLHTPFSLTLEGTPSDLLYLGVSVFDGFVLKNTPKFEMALIANLGSGTLIALGSVPPSGTLVLPATLPPDGALLGVPIVMQIITRNPVTNVSRFGHAATIIGMP